MMGLQSGQMSMLVLDFTELIPDHHLLRKISQAISFDFIYEILKPYYPANGRPSVDPVSMFKMLLVGYLYGIKSERRLVQEVQLNIAYRWFCGFELADKQDKMGNELSKGMMQKVSICCALTVKPRVILLDEPMVGLDPKAIKELKEVVRELGQQGVTVLISTHMLEMVEDLWDIMFVMEKGHIIGSYTREEVGDKDLDALFFEMTGGEES